MSEIRKDQPTFSEVMTFVVSLATSIENSGINLNQPISPEERQTVLHTIEKSDDRLRNELVKIIGLGMLDSVKNSIGSNYGDKTIGASSLTLLEIFTANTYPQTTKTNE